MSKSISGNDLFNIDILILSKEHLARLKPVTKLNVFEPNSKVFSMNGLFSTEIFGPIGSDMRNNMPSYIDIKLDILHPLAYQHIVSLKTSYEEIMSGKAYAIFDKNENDFVIVDETTERANTGYSFFMNNINKVVFADNDSDQRKYKIDFIKKYGNKESLINKWVVIPAGLRDYTVDDKGQPSEDEINTLYRKLLSTVSMLDNINIKALEAANNTSLIDPIRLRIQNITIEIYEYLKTLLDGKHKFIQGKWAKRAIMHGTRNVITPTPMYVTDLDSENRISFNHTVIGIYQYIKAISPITMNKLHTKFINKIFTPNSNSAVLVDPKSMKTVITDISVKKRDEWLSLEGLNNIMSKLAQDEIKTSPVVIEGYYLLLVYDSGKEVKVIFDTNDITEDMNTKFIRPITYAEIMYLAVYDISNKYPAFLTRYPVVALGGIYPTKLYLKTTVKGRKVKINIGGVTDIVNEYPILKESFINSVSPHYSKLARLTADLTI